jgi:AraC family transcriptional regulator
MAAAQKALWYIESHFGAGLALGDVAAAAGRPVVRYLRARRLSEAGRELAAGAGDILDVALSAGYSSHEAFTRAFREQFGVTPEEVRKRGSLDLARIS